MARLMVLDEDPELRRFLSIFLESLGHEIRFEGGSGHVGLAALAKDPEGFDAIVTELRLPIADGLDVLAGTRALATAEGPVPVIIASRFWTEEEVALARGFGVHAAILKPFDMDRLAAEIVRAGDRRDSIFHRDRARVTHGEAA
jgi:DNA-binding response OmpR family regulator